MRVSVTEPMSQYGLGETEFERAIKLLDQVEHSLRLPWWQRLIYRLYGIFMGAIATSLCAAVLIPLAWKIFKGESAFVLLIFAYIVALLGFLGALIFIPLNLPLLIKVHRQKVRLQQLGMTDVWVSFVREQSGRRRWGAILRKIALGVGGIMFAGGVLGYVTTGDVTFLLFLCGAGLVLVMFYFLQEGKVWLNLVASRFNEIAELKQGLTSQSRQESGQVAVPTELLKKFEQIQSKEILIGRANAIAAFKPSAELFSVLTSPEVLKQKSSLDSGVRLKVEEAIEDLMQEPKIGGVRTDVQTGFLHYPIDSTGLEIVYAVEEKEHRLRLIELRQIAEGAHA